MAGDMVAVSMAAVAVLAAASMEEAVVVDFTTKRSNNISGFDWCSPEPVIYFPAHASVDS
jgi:hypothetical protein